jgi:DNA replicative helicase MCM subunit Mcm2 (Cdc46/Mcm family)
MDVIAVGKSKSQQDRIKSLRDIIRELQKESGAAYIESIKEKASEQGLDPDKVDKEISLLCQGGELYEERHGYYKIV